MPRGWRETHKPETADSYRGRRRLPWRRDDSSLPSESAKVNETRKTKEFPMGVTPVVLNEAVEAFSSNTTESLTSNNYDTHYSTADNPQLVTKGAQEIMGSGSNPSSLEASGFSCARNQGTSLTNASKPLSLFPFLGMPSTVGSMAFITSPTSPSVPQWMQLLTNQDAQRIMQDISSGVLHFCWLVIDTLWYGFVLFLRWLDWIF